MSVRGLSRIFLAAVWLGMGLGAKVLGLAPRHREIVARVLGEKHADTLTIAIGLGEVGMAAWILSGRFPRTCAATQIALVIAMNVLELTIARDLLLFGAWNGVVAAAFILVVALTLWPRHQPPLPRP